MTTYSIRQIGDPVLRQKADDVTEIDGSLADNAHTMIETMYAAPGGGLAATQVGITKRYFVFDTDDGPKVAINPEIVEERGECEWTEGCLSIPGYVAEINRRERVWVEAQDRHGRPFKFSEHGFVARAVQHELDHLKGTLYIDYLESLDELIPVNEQDDPDEDPESPSAKRRKRAARVAGAHSH